MNKKTASILAAASAAAGFIFCVIIPVAAAIIVGGSGIAALSEVFGKEAGFLGAFALAGLIGFFLLRQKNASETKACGGPSKSAVRESTIDDMSDKPLICTLSPADIKAGLSEMSALAKDALIDYEKDDLTLRLRYRRSALDKVRSMVQREQSCCGFLDIDLRENADVATVTIHAPEKARDSVGFIFDYFTGAAKLVRNDGA